MFISTKVNYILHLHMHKAEQGFIHIKAYKQGRGSKIGEDKKKKRNKEKEYQNYP